MLLYFHVAVYIDDGTGPPEWLDLERSAASEKRRFEEAIEKEIIWHMKTRGLDARVRRLEGERA